MKLFIQMPAEYGGIWFTAFYLLSFLLCMIFLYFQGYRRNFPMPQWTLLIASGIFLFIVGTKLFTYSAEQWKTVFTLFQFPDTNGKTILGGLVLLVPALILLKKLLQFQHPVYDLVALILPMMMGIQRVGCLLSGCCFGKPTHLGWGIIYGQGSHAFQAQLERGLIALNDLDALPVHPTQAYQVLGCLLIAVIVWKTRKLWKNTLSQLLFSILLYAGLRFFEEFFRDPTANIVAVKTIFGLRMVQWYLLISAPILVMLIVFAEKKYRFRAEVRRTPKPQIQFFVGLLLLTITYFLQDWFSPAESLTLLSALTGWGAVNLFLSYWTLTIPGFRWTSPAALVAGFLFMGQAMYIPDENTKKITYQEIKAGEMFSNYQQAVSQFLGKYSDECGAHPKYGPPELRRYNTFTSGLEYSYTEIPSRYRQMIFKVGGFFVVDQVKKVENNQNFIENSAGIRTFFQYDWRYLGIGAGFNLGGLRYAEMDKNAEKLERFEWENSKDEYLFIPGYYLRLGPRDILYLEGEIANHFPSSTPMPYYSVGLGSGLGRADGTSFGFGLADESGYLKVKFPITNKFFIDAWVANNFQSGSEARSFYSLGIAYRFKHTRVEK